MHKGSLKNKMIDVLEKLNSKYVVPDFLDKSHLPSLDGWRAVSIIIVIIGHSRLTTVETSFYHQLIKIFIYESLGVRIFFMLSGFLITTLLIKEYIRHRNINIKNFFIKRALRIFPVFYLYLIAVFLINKFFHLNLIVDHFLGPMLYINNFNFFKTTWLTGHTWSLAVEEQFYLIFPFVFSHASNKLWAFCVGIILLTQFIRIFCYLKPEYENILLFPFLGYAEAIFVGALLSIASFKGLFNSEQRLWSNKKLVPIGIFIIIMIYYFTSRGIFGVFLLPFGSITLNLFIGFLLLQSILNKNTVIYRFLNLNFMINIGLISYSLYIWQQLFMIPLNVYPGLKNWPVFPFNILFSFLMAYISYHFFEKFFLKMKGKFITNPI